MTRYELTCLFDLIHFWRADDDNDDDGDDDDAVDDDQTAIASAATQARSRQDNNMHTINCHTR